MKQTISWRGGEATLTGDEKGTDHVKCDHVHISGMGILSVPDEFFSP